MLKDILIFFHNAPPEQNPTSDYIICQSGALGYYIQTKYKTVFKAESMFSIVQAYNVLIPSNI